MSVQCDQVIAAPELQSRLGESFGFDPTDQREPVNFLRFITSDMNTQGILTRQVDTQDARKRDVEVTYFPRILETEVTDAACKSCDTGGDLCQLVETYSLAQCVGVSHGIQLSLADLEPALDNDEFFVEKAIRRLMDVLTRRMDSIIVNQATALVGNFASTGSAAKITTRTKATTATDSFSNLLAEDVEEFVRRDHNFGLGDPIVLAGYGLLDRYWNAAEWSGVSDAEAVDWGRQLTSANFMSVSDRRIPDGDGGLAGFGADCFIATIPGALQLLTFNKNRGSAWRDVDVSTLKQRTMLTDPFTGVTFDYHTFTTCDAVSGHDVIQLNLELSFKLVGMPTDMFCVGDRQDGVTYLWQFLIDNS